MDSNTRDKSSEGPVPDTPKRKWVYDIWFVVVMLITIGPFAFPLLWKSPKFGRGTKWTLTILFILITVFAIIISIETAKFTWHRFQELQSMLR